MIISEREDYGQWKSVGWILLGWAMAAVLIGSSNWTESPGLVPLILVSGVTIPPVIAYVAMRNSAIVRDFVHSLDIRILILIHSLRMIGFGFLFLYNLGHLHPLFAFPAAIGDAMAAIGALVLGISLFKGMDVSAATISRWNRFGLGDFVIAVSAGFMLRSDLLGTQEWNTDLMGSMPLIIFPLLLVPLMVIIHLMIARKLQWQLERHA
jgi:hypothetical protein